MEYINHPRSAQNDFQNLATGQTKSFTFSDPKMGEMAELRRENGNLSLLSFWESVRPAIIPGDLPNLAPLAPSAAPPEGGLTQAVTLLVARVGGEPPLLSLDSLLLG